MTEENPPVRVELSYTLEGVSKQEAANRAYELMQLEPKRVGGFACGTSYKEPEGMPTTVDND